MLKTELNCPKDSGAPHSPKDSGAPRVCEPESMTRLRQAAAVAVYALLFASCGSSTRYTVLGTSHASSTDGTVTVEPVEDNFTLVHVDLQHLPSPAEVAKDHASYVVWIRNAGAKASNAGALAYDATSRLGSFMTTVKGRTFEVIVTAELSDDVSKPSRFVVAKQDIK